MQARIILVYKDRWTIKSHMNEQVVINDKRLSESQRKTITREDIRKEKFKKEQQRYRE